MANMATVDNIIRFIEYSTSAYMQGLEQESELKGLDEKDSLTDIFKISDIERANQEIVHRSLEDLSATRLFFDGVHVYKKAGKMLTLKKAASILEDLSNIKKTATEQLKNEIGQKHEEMVDLQVKMYRIQAYLSDVRDESDGAGISLFKPRDKESSDYQDKLVNMKDDKERRAEFDALEEDCFTLQVEQNILKDDLEEVEIIEIKYSKRKQGISLNKYTAKKIAMLFNSQGFRFS